MTNWRNPAFNAFGTIDCEIEHPVFGWIPFTVDPSDTGSSVDVVTLDAEIRLASGITPYTPPLPDPDVTRRGMVLTRRQVLSGLMLEGLISTAEASGPAHVPPAAIEAVFAAMPEPKQSLSRITWANFTVAFRLDPIVPVIAAAATPPLDDAALDAFFATYAAI